MAFAKNELQNIKAYRKILLQEFGGLFKFIETLNETKLCRVDQSLSILTFILFLKRGDKSFAKMALKMQFALHEGVDCTFRYCQ